jgi:two-component system, OmpR family, sensor histidine kinase MprB
VSFRARLTLVAASAVAVVVVLASVLVFVVVRGQLRGEIDNALRQTAREFSSLPPDLVERALFRPRSPLGGAEGYPQVVQADGRTIRPEGATVPLPVNDDVIAVAKGDRNAYLTDADVEGTHIRMITFPYPPDVAIQVARPLTEVDNTLEEIKTFLFFIALAGIGVAAALGLIVSQAAIAPVTRLTQATERVTETGDLTERIDATGQDELSRLAGSFNAMLGALEESTKAQRQLVADASHELRTPLTSLRTNFEVLMSDRELDPEERRRLLDDVVEQIAEMTTLIA